MIDRMRSARFPLLAGVVLTFAVPSAARASDRSAPGSRWAAESALSQVVAQRAGFERPEPGMHISDPYGYAHCAHTGVRRLRCRFSYMPGNTIFVGTGTVRLSRVRALVLRARYQLRVTVTRLPPSRHVRWRGSQLVYFGQAP